MAETITTDARLCGLLRTARRSAHLNQKEAASKSGCSPSWWRRVESAPETKVDIERMTDMLDAVGIIPEHLNMIDRPLLAGALSARHDFRTVSCGEELETYLMSAPAPEALRLELAAYVRARTQKMFHYRPEPGRRSSGG